MSLQIKSYTRNPDQNSNILGFVSFYIPEWGLYLNSCKYIRNKNGGFFIGFPSKEKDDKYFPYYLFDADKNKRFQESARKAIEEYLNNQNISIPQPEEPEFDLF